MTSQNSAENLYLPESLFRVIEIQDYRIIIPQLSRQLHVQS